MFKSIYYSLLGILLAMANSISYAQRGCCSHHGGVAYCDNNIGRQVCRDGSYSPSCGCAIRQDVINKQPATKKPDTPSESKSIFKKS